MLLDIDTFVLPYLAVASAVLYYLHRSGAHEGRTIVIGIMLIYGLMVTKLTILPIRVDKGYNEWARSVDWRQFVTLSTSGLSAYLSSRQGIGNILMGIPFGLLFPITSVGVRGRRVLIMSLIMSSGIEVSQLALNISGYAFPIREIDARDVISNVLGSMIGLAVFRMLAWIYRSVVHAPPHSGRLWGYFHRALTH